MNTNTNQKYFCSDSPFIVAEIGCNHKGNPELAKDMVKIAADCGVNGVKFQTFNSELLISRYAPKADYQKITTGTNDSQLDMTKKLELKPEDFLSLKEYAESLGLVVFSTPFDLESIDFLEKNGQAIWKIPAGEITNKPYLEKIGKIEIENKVILLSTGMSTIDEIRQAIDILNSTRKNRIILLHCNTEYPTPDKDVNVSALKDIKENFPEFEIGYSDHSVGSVAATLSVAFGVKYIEKHFTLNKQLAGPDHVASATPEELKELVENVKRATVQLGVWKKVVTESEGPNKIVARKSIVAKTAIKKGETFTEENIICKRPGNGISPMHWYEVLGQTAERDFDVDELITDSRFESQE